MKTSPARLEILTIALKDKNIIVISFKDRESCCANRLWRDDPTTINKLDLAKAWVKTWNRHKKIFPIDKETNISPNWLKVDRATTFLASLSNKAAVLATANVVKPKINHILKLTKVIWPIRITSQIPAVTKVELWTRALTGVGAAMAAGNQLIKGHWALLVKATKLITITIKLLILK